MYVDNNILVKRFDEKNIEGTFRFNETEKALFIEVEPTNTALFSDLKENDWFRTNFLAFQKSKGFLRYHLGFFIAWKHLEVGLKKFLELIDPLKVEYVYAFGHSLGGAVSGITAYESRKYFPNVKKIFHWSFGAPRFLKGFLSRKIFTDRVVSFSYRYGHDIVSIVPPLIWRFLHPVKPVRFSSDGKWKFKNFITHHEKSNYLRAFNKNSFYDIVLQRIKDTSLTYY